MIINRYIGKEVIQVMLSVLSVLVLIFLCTEFSRYLQQAAQGNIPANALLRLFCIAVPALVSLLLPLAYFLGLLLGYGRLYVDNEMVVMNACGMSRKYLLRVTMKQAVVLAVIVASLDFWLVPYLARYKEQLLSNGAVDSVLQTILPGQFQQSPDGKQVFYIQSIAHDRHQMDGIFMAQTSNTNLPKRQVGNNHSWDVVYAATAYETKDLKTQASFFTSAKGFRYIGAPGEPNYMIIQYGTYSIRLPDSAVASESTKAQALPTFQLLANYRDPTYAAEFQWRAALPISVLLMAFLAVPLSRVRPRQGRFVKLVPAILIYLVYANMLYVARSWVSQGTVSIEFGMWWIHIVLFFVAALFYINLNPVWRLFKR